MSEDTALIKTSKRTGAHPDQISLALDDFFSNSKGVLVREYLIEKLNAFETEHVGKLRTVKTLENLKHEQGMLSAFDLAKSAINTR